MDKEINSPFVLHLYFFWILIATGTLILSICVVYAVLPEHPEHPNSLEKREWCAEYHPEKSGFECSRIAGW